MSNLRKANVARHCLFNPMPHATEGVYPQSDGSIVVVDFDASTGFVDQWVHLSFAIFVNFDLKKKLKSLEMACDQVQTCLIFPLRSRWACFPIKMG